jgi:hypothetical protein
MKGQWLMRDGPRLRELEWYRRHGSYLQRIATDGSGAQYVIGDWAWNRHHPDMTEEIELRMRREGVYTGSEIR